MILALFVIAFASSVVPATLFLINIRSYPQPPAPQNIAAVSVLIPARNEAAGICDAVRSVLASTGVTLEVIVMDDSSTDGTDMLVLALAASDSRLHLEHAPSLPAGWNGKQHACWALAKAATHPILCFVDADVRLESTCVSRMATFLEGKSLVSGFPRQTTGTALEWLLLPIIHFVLLGFLPLNRMRRGTDPAFAAGCGQFMMVRSDDYFACGGHSGIKLTMHDGLRLPHLFREHGFATDLADLTALARCRMYTSAGQVWSGLAKNATEGIAAPARIVPISLVLFLGQVLPYIVAVVALVLTSTPLNHASSKPAISNFVLTLMLLAMLVDLGVRVVAAIRFRQDWRSALLHPVGIVLLLAVQWYALIRKILGRPVSWRSRAYQEQ